MDFATLRDTVVLIVAFVCFSPQRVFSANTETWISQIEFSCLRPSTPCVNTTSCDVSTGQCVCSVGSLGLQCELMASPSDLDGLACAMSSPCVHGQCYDLNNGQGAICSCESGYYGDKCQLAMVDVDCEEDRMRVYVRPWGYNRQTWTLPAPELISSKDTVAPQMLHTLEMYANTYPGAIMDPGREGFVGEFRHLSDLAGPARVDFENETFTTYSREVRVRYGTVGPHPTDEVLTIKCTVPIRSSPATPTLPYTLSLEVLGGQWQCGRPSTPCQGPNSTCNTITDQCECAPGMAGLQCTLQEGEINSGECTFNNPCDQEGATCFDNGNGAKCECLNGYYGDRCQHPPAVVECHEDRMVVSMRPYGYHVDTWPANNPPYTDDVFSVKCEMKTVGEMIPDVPDIMSKGWEGFVAVFYYVNDPCAGDSTLRSSNETTAVYSTTINIGYDWSTPHYTDQLIKPTCTVPTTAVGEAAVTTTTTTVSQGPDSKPPDTAVTGRQSPTPDVPPPFTSTLIVSRPGTTASLTTITTTTILPTTTSTQGQSVSTRPTQPPSSGSQGQPLPSNHTQSSSSRPSQQTPDAFGQGRSTPDAPLQGQGQGRNQGHLQSTTPAPEVLRPPPRVKIVMTDEGGNPVRGKVKLGSMVLVTFSVDPSNNGEGVTDLKVDRCTVTDVTSGTTLEVVKDSCAQRPLGILIFRKRPGVRILIIRVCKFPSSVTLNFLCQVRMCRSNDTYCSKIPNCPLRFRRSTKQQPVFAVNSIAGPVKFSLDGH